jgi:3-oxoacyl-[acyl-carrier protein] reductase
MTKRIAVIGGSGGIGASIAQLASRNAKVTIGYKSNREKAEVTAKQIRDLGGFAEICEVNIVDGESVSRYFKTVQDQWGGIDAIVSATGPAFEMNKITEVDDDKFRHVVETDIIGSFNILKRGVPFLQQAGGGSIVLLLTIAVMKTLETDAMSTVPKMGVEGLIRTAAREFGADGIRVNGVAPGSIKSNSIHFPFDTGDSLSPVAKMVMAQTPLGRKGEPHEVAELAAFLLSDAASYVSGQIIAADGGFSA